MQQTSTILSDTRWHQRHPVESRPTRQLICHQQLGLPKQYNNTLHKNNIIAILCMCLQTTSEWNILIHPSEYTVSLYESFPYFCWTEKMFHCPQSISCIFTIFYLRRQLLFLGAVIQYFFPQIIVQWKYIVCKLKSTVHQSQKDNRNSSRASLLANLKNPA